MTTNFVQAFFGFIPLEVSIVAILSLVAIGYLTIRLAGKRIPRRASDGSCTNPNFYCMCAICGKLRQLYRTEVKLHKRLNKMRATLIELKEKLGYPKPPPDKFPYLKKTMDIDEMDSYERKLNDFQVELESYHLKLKRALEAKRKR